MKKTSGFTLVELMIVVVIIGILASLAIPNFLFFRCKSRQAEAKSSLGAIANLEEVYFIDHGDYTASKSNLGFAMKGNQYYSYTISVDAAGDSFNATATATDATLNGDVWQMNQERVLDNVTPGCVSP